MRLASRSAIAPNGLGSIICDTGNGRIVARDPYSQLYLTHRGWTDKEAHARVFPFREWEYALECCYSSGINDIDFLISFPGWPREICLKVRAAAGEPMPDYAALW